MSQKNRDAEFEKFKLLSEEEQLAYFREDRDKYFTPEHKVDKPPVIHMSPSGKYRLETSGYATSPGCWSYTRGEIYLVSNDTLIADVKRNYSSMDYLWIENHTDGHDYLVTGEDYQGQTVVQLDTGKTKTVIPPEAFLGIAFCWGNYKLIAPNLLLVEGCYWACPYGYMVCDISNIMEGWPYILDENGENLYLDSFDRSALTFVEGKLVYEEFEERHNITSLTKQEIENQEYMASLQRQKGEYRNDSTLQVEANKKLDELELILGDEGNFSKEVHLRKIYTIDGHKAVLIENWESDDSKAKSAKMDAASKKNKEEREEWLKNDPLLNHLKERGVQYNCAVYYASALDKYVYENPNPATFNLTIDNVGIEWGVLEGPITVVKSKTEYARTKEGMDVCLRALSTQAKTS